MDTRTMFYGAKSKTFEVAKQLRENMTVSEKVLWSKLNKKQLLGLRFKPQHPIGKYVADFYCHSLKLVIEVDGDIHKTTDQIEYDIYRTKDLEDLGLSIIRFQNEEVLYNEIEVLNRIINLCKKLECSRDSSPL